MFNIIKKYLFISIFFSSLIFALSTEKKIKSSKNNLNKSLEIEKKTTTQLDKIAKDIEDAQNDNIELNRKLSLLSDEYQKNESSYNKSKEILSKFDKNLKEISREIDDKKDKYINLLAQQFSVIHAMTQSHEANRESIIKQEMYKLYKIYNDQELKYLQKQILNWKKQKKEIIKDRIVIKHKINKLSQQRDKYKRNREEKKNILNKLESNEDRYKAKLQETLDKQNALRSTLADLNIIHRKELAEEKRRIKEQKARIIAERKRKRAERKKRRLERAKARKAGKKVVYNTKKRKKKKRKKKKYSSNRHKVYSYKGAKTISPLKSSRVVKSFGSYIDPIYKIRIFNESVTLKSSTKNAKVFNVLNGKVVFAGNSSMLGKVVVVAHGRRMHTIYAGLSKIAPNLKKGSRIQKGYVIGKISRKLIFEATKNSKHINPMKLIRI
ncbi:Membrane-bound metallopeptidase [hydrothermal vent metagenome]|uniref:Membrane-bound metallopeptidase n=1 Tax=hydrothermal vent metagenome TaxID=652676 RepID=A0A1W1CBW9_9ZZZZ